MQVYSAVPISGKVFVGKVRIHRQRQYPPFPKSVDKSQAESELLKLKQAIRQLETDIKVFLHDPEVSQLDKDILSTHLMIVTDIEITQIMETAIAQDLLSAPQTVQTSFDKIIRNFEQMDNSYFAQRADDYKDVAHRLMRLVLGDKEQSGMQYRPDEVVFVREITPSLVSILSRAGVKAYCTEHGSHTSHSSILSRAIGFTALVAKESVIAHINDGETAILDAINSRIVINPDTDEQHKYEDILRNLEEKEVLLQKELAKHSITQNGISISVKANIEYPGELTNVLNNRCDGIGLFRTEFIYLNRNSLPDEEEQTKVYSDLLSKMEDKPVTIRTFDLGGDKLAYLQQYSREENPYLGCRGIRFSLEQNSLFRTQVRAVLRASVHGNALLMFPMIISSEDFLAAKNIVLDCMAELDKESIPYNKNLPIGAMIETPSAALCAEQLAMFCDFFSLGTNDLVQYTLAVDRNNDKVAPYYVQYHPAVLQLVKQTITAAEKAGIPVSICGEMASDLMFVPLLAGLGIRDLSINPAKAAEVKAVIRNCDADLFDLVRDFDFKANISSVEHFLKNTLKPYYTIQS